MTREYRKNIRINGVDKNRCKAIVRESGERCRFTGSIYGYCAIHYNMRHGMSHKRSRSEKGDEVSKIYNPQPLERHKPYTTGLYMERKKPKLPTQVETEDRRKEFLEEYGDNMIDREVLSK